MQQDELSVMRAEVARVRRVAWIAIAVACVAFAAAVVVPLVSGPGETIEVREAEGVTRIGPGTVELSHGDGRISIGTAPLPHVTFELGGQPWIAMQVSRLADPERPPPRGTILLRSPDRESLLQPGE